MSVSLRDLDRRVDALPATHFDAADLMRQGEARLRRRRIAAVAVVTAVVVAVVGGTVLVGAGSRNASEVPPADQKNTTPDDTNRGHDQVTTRLAQRRLTYAVGSSIHWGDTTIDVARQANTWGRRGDGKLIEYVDATDDGAVFVVGGAPYGNFKTGELTIPVGASAVWFTDGSAPVRIGTTHGDLPRGFEIAPTAEGSTLAWADPGSKTQPGQIVVYDTARMSEVARFGNPDAEPLAVYPDVVYWSPTGTNCDAYPGGWWGRAACQGTGPVLRFDTTSGQQSRVSRAAYLADRQARPGLLTGPRDHGQGSLFDGFERRGDRLFVDGGDPTLVLTGQPLRLRLPADNRNPDNLTLTQWLDPDRVVLVGTDSHHDNDLVVCRLSTGRCQVTVRIPDAIHNFAAPGPAISRG